jgi:hypothetical protein
MPKPQQAHRLTRRAIFAGLVPFIALLFFFLSSGTESA